MLLEYGKFWDHSSLGTTGAGYWLEGPGNNLQGDDYDADDHVLQFLDQGLDITSIQDMKWGLVAPMKDLKEVILGKKSRIYSVLKP